MFRSGNFRVKVSQLILTVVPDLPHGILRTISEPRQMFSTREDSPTQALESQALGALQLMNTGFSLTNLFVQRYSKNG